MTRARQTEATLKAASDHLYYEYWMFNSLTQALASGIAQQGWLLNSLLESWVVHLRALLDFAYPAQSAKPDDIVAVDFFDDPSNWEAVRPAMSTLLILGRERANKEIVHLSYKRIGITPEDKQWQFVELSAEIEKLMTAFLRQVPKGRLGPRWPANSGSVA